MVYNDLRCSFHLEGDDTQNQKENLLVMTYPYYSKIIDLGWYPFRNEGEYCLVLTEYAEGVEHLGYWIDPIFIYKSAELPQIIDVINHVLYEVSRGRLL